MVQTRDQSVQSQWYRLETGWYKVGGADQRLVGKKAGNCVSSVRGPCMQSYDEDVSVAADDDHHIEDNIDDDDDVNDIGCPLE